LEQWWKDTAGGKLCNHRKIHPSATLSTTNSTWTARGLNLGLHPERQPTIHLSSGTVFLKGVKHLYKHWNYTGVLIIPYPNLLPDVFCLMVRILCLMLVLLYT